MDEEQKKLAEEAMKRQEAQRAAEKAEAEKAAAELRKVMDTPIGEVEGAKKLAEISVQRSQLNAYRQSLENRYLSLQVEQNKIAAQIAALDCDEAVIRRQMLNSKGA